MPDQFHPRTSTGAAGGGNPVLAVLCGVLAAVIGALIWMAVEVLLHLQIGYVAILIGLMVGMSIRLAGHGQNPLYGILGAALTLAGCLGGEILSLLYAASTPQQGLLDLAKSADYVQMVTLIFTKMGIMGYVINGIGVYEGYVFSMRK